MKICKYNILYIFESTIYILIVQITIINIISWYLGYEYREYIISTDNNWIIYDMHETIVIMDLYMELQLEDNREKTLRVVIII